MNKVRLGRALGYGTRHLAKTAAAVAAAAAAPDPSRTAPQAAAARSEHADARADARADAPAANASPARSLPHRPTVTGEVLPPRRSRAGGLGSRAHLLKRSIWQPLAVFSAALWLRVSGTFFALIAVTMGTAAWRQREDLHSSAGSFTPQHVWLFAALAVLFGYFAVSSFIRAHLTERRASLGR